MNGVEKQANVKETGKAERKSVPQKKVTIGKEKKPSIHERLEINKKIIQEKQGKYYSLYLVHRFQFIFRL